MNTLSFTAACCLTLCLASAAMGQYTKSSGPYQQRKMAPVPNTYSSASDYQQAEPQQGYGQSASKYPMSSQYEERQQAASYGSPMSAPKSSSYGQQSAAYGQSMSSYGKQAAKYEEPHYPPMPFAWGYDINDGYGGAQYHKENGDEYGKRTGSYGYTDAYGIYRQVDYVADEYGFRATIKTNEPGTANESPADVDLHAYEPPSNYYAGNTQSYGSAPAYQPKQSSYGASMAKPAMSSSYSAPAKSSYRPASSGYSSGSSGYQAAASAPASNNYQRQQYGMMQHPQAASSGYQQQQQQQQEYSSSVLVPVYQKASVAPKKRLI